MHASQDITKQSNPNKENLFQKTSIVWYLCKSPLLFARCIRWLKRATDHASINLTRTCNRSIARLNYLEIYLFI